METLGVSLLIGATLGKNVAQSFASLNSQAQKTTDYIENIQIGKDLADDLIETRDLIKNNEFCIENLGRTAERVKLNEDLNKHLQEATREAERFGITLENAGKKSKEFGRELKKAEFRDKFPGQIAEVTSGFASLAGTVITAKSALLGITAPAVSFQDSMATVSTLVDTSKVSMDELSKSVLDISKSFGLSANTVASGMYQALSAGVEVADLSGFMETAAKAATAGKIDISTAIDGMSSAVNAYGKANLSAALASDIMFQTVNRGKTRMAELSASLSNVTPIASSLGVKFSDISAAIATLTYSGVQTSVSTTQIRAALSELSKDGSKVSQLFRQTANVSFKEYIAQGHSLGDAFNLLGDTAKKNGKELTDIFGSIEGAQAVMALTGAASQRFAEDLKIMGNSAGATETAFEKMRKTMGFQLNVLNEQWEIMQLIIGNTLLPVLNTFIGILTPALTLLAGIVDVAPGLVPLATGFATVVGSVLAMNKAITTAKALWATFNLIVAANPVMLVVSAIIVGIGLIYAYWEPISEWFERFFGIIKYMFGFADKLPSQKKKEKTDKKTNKKANENETGSADQTVTNKNGIAKLPEIQTVNPVELAQNQDLGSTKIENQTHRYTQNQIPATTNKTVNVTISNFTINSQSIDEALPKIVDRVREAIRQGVNEEMENSYAY